METFDLPQELLPFLPSDPFQQLDFAHKITSIALATRISDLESELLVLRDELRKDVVVADLQDQIESLNVSLSNVLDELSGVDHEKEILLKKNASLLEEAKMLNRHVTKLEGVKKTLMMSLQDEKGSSANDPPVSAPTKPNHTSISSQSFARENDEPAKPSTVSPIKASRARVSLGALLASETSASQLTPPGSPPSALAFRSPTRTSTSVSPRRLSVSFATTRSISDDRSPASSSAASSPYRSMSGQTRVDGKDFFRQVRSRLSCDQFSAFLANVKNLKSHKQTKEDTLLKVDDIFGPGNKDLYVIFEGLFTRNVH